MKPRLRTHTHSPHPSISLTAKCASIHTACFTFTSLQREVAACLRAAEHAARVMGGQQMTLT